MVGVVYMNLCRGRSKLFVAFNSQPRHILPPVMVESQAINRLCLFFTPCSVMSQDTDHGERPCIVEVNY